MLHRLSLRIYTGNKMKKLDLSTVSNVWDVFAILCVIAFFVYIENWLALIVIASIGAAFLVIFMPEIITHIWNKYIAKDDEQ